MAWLGCKRKIEFDQCDWERKDGRKAGGRRGEERATRGCPGAARTTGLLGGVCALFVCRAGRGAGGVSLTGRKEGRKEGTIRRDGKSNQRRGGPPPGGDSARGAEGRRDYVRLETIIVGPIRFRSSVTPRAEALSITGSLLKAAARHIHAAAAAAPPRSARNPRARGNDSLRKEERR